MRDQRISEAGNGPGQQCAPPPTTKAFARKTTGNRQETGIVNDEPQITGAGGPKVPAGNGGRSLHNVEQKPQPHIER